MPDGDINGIVLDYVTICKCRRSGAANAVEMSDTTTRPKGKIKAKTEKPRLYKIVLLNDDYTPQEFVVAVLRAVFQMSDDQAYRVMMIAHRLGSAVVAVYTRDIADTKATEATDAGRRAGYPLMFSTEPEE